MDAFTRRLTACIASQAWRDRPRVAGSLRSRAHSAGARRQNSVQAGVGRATAVVGICEALGWAATLLVPISRAAAAVMTRRTAARTAMLKAATPHSTGPNCPLASPSFALAHALGNDL